MKREVGLWIDQHRTLMVTVVNEKEETREIRSNIKKHVKLSPNSPVKKPKSTNLSGVEDVGERKYETRLSGYYDGVVSLLRNADSVWIFGPGEAKDELKKRLDIEASGKRIISLETVEKMSDRQIVAKVLLHYQQ